MSEKNLYFDFLSRECRRLAHYNCGEEWPGLGVDVRCNCHCHSREQLEVNSNCQDRTAYPKIISPYNKNEQCQNQKTDLGTQPREQPITTRSLAPERASDFNEKFRKSAY